MWVGCAVGQKERIAIVRMVLLEYGGVLQPPALAVQHGFFFHYDLPKWSHTKSEEFPPKHVVGAALQGA